MNAPAQPLPQYSQLGPGDPAPWFIQRSPSNPAYAFDGVAGRYVVMCFYASASDPVGRAAVDAAMADTGNFDDRRACFFGVSIDPRDAEPGGVVERLPGIRFFWDFDGAVSRLFGALPRDSKPGQSATAMRFWLVLDPGLRVLKGFPLHDSDAMFAYLDALPPPDRSVGFEVYAPVLVVPNVFEPAFCEKLIQLYDETGGELSGVMREVDGKTVGVVDRGYKVRKDVMVDDAVLIQQIQARIVRRIVPEIRKIHQFDVTRMERYLIGCYAAEDGAHFQPHRDNTTKGTAHRRFAVSINLNDNFRGGEVMFPEYGGRKYKPPPGGAVVFSCSLLHAVSKVTKGRRYAFLPFLYDDAAAKQREANNVHLKDVAPYQPV